jgi:integrase
MAAVTFRSGKWQIRVKHRLLPKPFFHTFPTEAEARAYVSQLETLLDRGIVPMDLMGEEKRGSDPMLSKLLLAYAENDAVAPSDVPNVILLADKLAGVRLSGVTAAWADKWVSDMKLVDNLAPSTIRKRVGSLARVIDWHWRMVKDGQPPVNALRLMPRGFSQYAQGAPGAKRDVVRDRRMHPGEEDAIMRALGGGKRPDRERALQVDPDFTLLFTLILNTGMRLSEAYRLRADQVDTQRWVINVEGSKGERGHIKPRVVPMVRPLRTLMADACARTAGGLLFPFWSGDEDDKRRCTNRLSARFSALFGYAGLDNFTEHDLRHEATCRWVTMRGPDGRWLFSEIEICRIMGWSDPKMMLVYASLRGEDLADRL